MVTEIKKRKPMSEKTKIKIRLSKIGKPFSGKSFNRKGLKHTEKTKEKMSLASLGKNKSLQHRLNISKGRKGIRFSEEHINNLKISHLGQKSWSKGKRFFQILGEKHPNWKGGISKIDKSCRVMPEYKQWRSDTFTRDNWTCQTCRIKGVYMTAHHIKSFSKIIKENNIKNIIDASKCAELWNIDNGITLCEECHKLTDNYRGRGILKSYK
jgi:hypothetical protein